MQMLYLLDFSMSVAYGSIIHLENLSSLSYLCNQGLRFVKAFDCQQEFKKGKQYNDVVNVQISVHAYFGSPI